MSIFDDIRKDRDFCGKLPGFAACDCEEDGCFHDQVNAVHDRRMSRLDRLERIALAAAELADSIQRSDPWEDIDAALAAFRAACGEGE